MVQDAKRHPDTRQIPSIGSPPDPDDLDGFPAWHVHAGTTLCRVTTSGLGPWWFSSDGQGRFDLEPPRGTCYLADEEVGALLEVLGPIAVVSTGWARRLVLWYLALPDQCRAAERLDQEEQQLARDVGEHAAPRARRVVAPALAGPENL